MRRGLLQDVTGDELTLTVSGDGLDDDVTDHEDDRSDQVLPALENAEPDVGAGQGAVGLGGHRQLLSAWKETVRVAAGVAPHALLQPLVPLPCPLDVINEILRNTRVV